MIERALSDEKVALLGAAFSRAEAGHARRWSATSTCSRWRCSSAGQLFLVTAVVPSLRGERHRLRTIARRFG